MKRNESKRQANEGITLIALVITVIIMLILAGVAINLTIGDNGIFRKSEEGAQIYKNAANNETSSLNEADVEMESLMDKYKGETANKPNLSKIAQKTYVTSETATEIEVKFIPTSQKQADEGYIIHPAFTNEGNGGFGDLDGIWVAKFEAVSNTPTASNGGGNSNTLKVQVIPNQPSWRYITTNNIFTVCRKTTNEGEVLAGSTVDSHMMKNTEWGAVAILSQSKYGIFNPQSSTGANGDETYQVWNNSSSLYITGSVGTSKDANNTATSPYNTVNGLKASTTGTVYGVYDMAGGGIEYVAGCLNGQENAKFGVAVGNAKYVDLYTNSSNSYLNYDGAKIGDATKETKGWNSDYSYFVYSSNPVFNRGR